MHHSLTGHNLIGAVPEVTEVDEGDTLTYSISGTDSSRFTVDSSTGEVYTKSDAGRFTAGAELSIKVSVSDGKNLLDGVSSSKDDTVNVTIRVLHNADPEFVTAGRFGVHGQRGCQRRGHRRRTGRHRLGWRHPVLYVDL